MNIDTKEKALEQVNAIKSGSKMYTIHKANWCGYCVQLMEKLTKLMKEFNKAGKKINIQISTVDEEHSDMYNSVRAQHGLSPVEPVESFPTIISEQKVPGPSNQTNASKVSQDELIEKVNSATTPVTSVTSVTSATSTNAALGSPMSMAPGSPVAIEEGDPEVAEVAEAAEIPGNPVSVSPIAPASLSADVIETGSNNGNKGNNGNNGNPKPLNQMGGYGLYPAIASTAYHLAPAGILLAAAAATFKCRKGKGRKNRTRKGRR